MSNEPEISVKQFFIYKYRFRYEKVESSEQMEYVLKKDFSALNLILFPCTYTPFSNDDTNHWLPYKKCIDENSNQPSLFVDDKTRKIGCCALSAFHMRV